MNKKEIRAELAELKRRQRTEEKAHAAALRGLVARQRLNYQNHLAGTAAIKKAWRDEDTEIQRRRTVEGQGFDRAIAKITKRRAILEGRLAS